MLSEFKLLERIRSQIPQSLRVAHGFKDDAAVIPTKKNENWLLTSDVLVDGVDFHVRKHRPEFIGRKVLAVNLSDIAAMGGAPVGFVIALGIPAAMRPAWIEKFYQGLMVLAKKYQTLCLGGDISKSKTFFAALTLLGKVEKKGYVMRSGARAGDLIGVTGRLGGSILSKHFHFEPRIHEAKFLVNHVKPSAMIDISDGFTQDLEHVIRDSRVGARVNLLKIPVSQDAREKAKGNLKNALKSALTDGEDFELIFTVSQSNKKWLDQNWEKHFPKTPLTWVGKIEKGKNLVWMKGARQVSDPAGRKKGYQHFGSI